MTPGLYFTPIAVLATLFVASGGSSPPPAGPDSFAAVETTCPVNISATNKGTADIWVMLYDSEVKRPGGIGSSYVKLKIQNHRVAPGATMSRTYDAAGNCNSLRYWRFKLKRGTDFYTKTISSDGGPYDKSQSVNLANLATHF